MKDFTLKQCKYTISQKDINPYTFDDFIRIIKRLLLNSSLLKIYLKLLTTNIIYGTIK